MKKYIPLFVFLAFVSFANLANASVLYSQSISLSPGWNIVSTPKVLESHTFSLPETSDNFDIYVLNASSTTGWSTLADLGQTEFVPLYGYFIKNKSASEQTLTFNYKAISSPNDRLFERSFSKSGWYSIGVANATYSKKITDDVSDTNNPSKILNSTTGGYASVVDLTDDSFAQNPKSVSVGSAWKQAVSSDIDSLNDLRETKGYAIYITQPNALYSGFQNEDLPKASVSITANGSTASTTVVASSSVTIAWSSINTSSCTVTPGDFTGVSGSQSIAISTSTTYSITCSGTYGGVATSSVVVNTADKVLVNLNLSINPSTPASTNIIANNGSNNNEADKVTVLSFDLNSQNGNTKITNISANVSLSVGDIPYVYLFDGSTILASETLLNNSVSFADLDLNIATNTTKTLTLKVDIANASSTVGELNANVGAGGIVSNSETVSGSATSNTLNVLKAGPVFTIVGSPTLTKASIGNTASSSLLATFTFDVNAQGMDVQIPSSDAFTVGVYINNAQVSSVKAVYSKPTSGVTGSSLFTIADGSVARFTAEVSFVAPTDVYVPGIANARLESIMTIVTSGGQTYYPYEFKTNSQAI